MKFLGRGLATEPTARLAALVVSQLLAQELLEILVWTQSRIFVDNETISKND